MSSINPAGAVVVCSNVDHVHASYAEQVFLPASQVLSAVEEEYDVVDEARQEQDKLEWEMRNEQRKLAVESQSATPAKGAAHQAAATEQAATAGRSLAAASRLLQESPVAVQQQGRNRPQRRPVVYDSPPPEVIELD